MEYDESMSYIFTVPEPLTFDESHSDYQSSNSDEEVHSEYLSDENGETEEALGQLGEGPGVGEGEGEGEGEGYQPLFPDDEEGSSVGSESASDISEDESPPDFPPPNDPSDSVENEGPQANKFREATATRRAFVNDAYAAAAVRKPPRSSSSMKRPAGATATTEAFAVEIAGEVIVRELKALAPLLRLPAGKDVDSKELTSVDIPRMVAMMKANAPALWGLLERVLSEDTRADKKDPEKIIVAVISTLTYQRSHHSNLLQKLLAIYLKFRGVSAKGFDMLHILGLTMSHKWACDVVERMSAQAMKEISEMLEEYPWVLSYDNVNIPFRVFAQRIDNQSQLGHGTAATVYIKQDTAKLSEELNTLLKEKRAQGIKNPLTVEKITELDRTAAPEIERRMVDSVLRM
ncbi:hypothetical protein NMY22_g10775 [Coprinellus aureogranulatus]|nr:hypothetical protein NMY22_g10775 [Coprinellus aureogranulatus]